MHQARFMVVSRWLRILFQIVLVLTPIAIVLNWSNSQIWFDFTQGDPAPFGVPIASFDLSTRVLCILVSFISGSMWMIVLYSLAQLFKLYEKGIIFAQHNVQYVKKIGIALCLVALLRVLTFPLLSIAITIHNPIGQRIVSAAFSAHDFFEIMMGLTVVLIGWVMQEGQKLQEEIEHII